MNNVIKIYIKIFYIFELKVSKQCKYVYFVSFLNKYTSFAAALLHFENFANVHCSIQSEINWTDVPKIIYYLRMKAYISSL